MCWVFFFRRKRGKTNTQLLGRVGLSQGITMFLMIQVTLVKRIKHNLGNQLHLILNLITSGGVVVIVGVAGQLKTPVNGDHLLLSFKIGTSLARDPIPIIIIVIMVVVIIQDIIAIATATVMDENFIMKLPMDHIIINTPTATGIQHRDLGIPVILEKGIIILGIISLVVFCMLFAKRNPLHFCSVCYVWQLMIHTQDRRNCTVFGIYWIGLLIRILHPFQESSQHLIAVISFTNIFVLVMFCFIHFNF